MIEETLQPEKPPTSEVLVIAGMSGAGRTTAAHALEDHGWDVVENMPPALFGTLAELIARSPEAFPRLAIVVDVRSRSYFEELYAALQHLANSGVEYRTVFLDADDHVLLQRFEAGRRPHPMQGNARLLDGIRAERDVVEPLKARADVVVDTTELNVHGLATEITELFSESGPVTLRLTIMSFGFKYGVPADANFVADMRFIPNPHWVPALRPHTGTEAAVADYVLSRPGVEDFLRAYVAMLGPVFEGYRRENKHYATLAIGCTGGKHRSVAVAEELARRLAQVPHVTVHVQHRDMGRE